MSSTRIMYIENKDGDGGIVGDARIGRVKFSKSGKSLYYSGKMFESLKKEQALKQTTLSLKRVSITGFLVVIKTVEMRCITPPLKLTKMCEKNIGLRYAISPITSICLQ